MDIPQRKGPPVRFAVDESPRADSTVDNLSRLRPVFKDGGCVTAGNASTISDGAAALVVCSSDAARRLGATPLARITGYVTAALEPKRIFFAPILAVRKLLQHTVTELADYDLIEINEAFAAQVLADGAELGFDWEKVNVNGGAIALGHPIGASGARILVTLIHALAQRSLRRGLATLCLGGREAVAMSVEML